MRRSAQSKREEPAVRAASDARFAKIAAALAGEPDVTIGGRGFGSGALKFRGKIFAMISSEGRFVVRLPEPRVAELVAAGKGARFSPRPGRPVKGWLESAEPASKWLGLARAALVHVRGG